MRFLVVDDDSIKVNLVRAFLIAQGAREADVLTADHAAGARVILERESLDVMLVDVLLPVRSGAKPLGETSVELLRQIVEDGTPRAPRHIVGMTASSDAIQEFGRDFRSLVMQVLHVSPELSEWKDALQGFLTFVKRADAAKDAFDYDVCVLDALRSPELEAVHATWPMQLEVERLLSRNITYRSGTLDVGGNPRRVACAHLSQMGPVAAVQAAECMLREFRPRVLLMTGICGGFADHVQVGDVVVAEKSWDWQAGKWSEEGTLLTAPDQKDGAAELVAIARGVDTQLPDFHLGFAGSRPPAPPKLVVGPMVTGSSVVASLDVQKVFRQQHRKMVAVDMECYGLYYACASHPGAQTKVLCVKAVSDLADRGKGDDFHRYCSYMSARVGLEVLVRFFGNPA